MSRYDTTFQLVYFRHMSRGMSRHLGQGQRAGSCSPGAHDGNGMPAPSMENDDTSMDNLPTTSELSASHLVHWPLPKILAGASQISRNYLYSNTQEICAVSRSFLSSARYWEMEMSPASLVACSSTRSASASDIVCPRSLSCSPIGGARLLVEKLFLSCSEQLSNYGSTRCVAWTKLRSPNKSRGGSVVTQSQIPEKFPGKPRFSRTRRFPKEFLKLVQAARANLCRLAAAFALQEQNDPYITSRRRMSEYYVLA